MSWTCPECRAEIESEFGICWDCRTTAPSLRDRRSLLDDNVDPNLVVNGPPWPASRACPECGGASYREVRAAPWIWTGLRKDRLCRRCRVRFRPPVPRWAACVYLASALLAVGAAGTLLAASLIPEWRPGWVQAVCPPLAWIAGHVFCVVIQLRE